MLNHQKLNKSIWILLAVLSVGLSTSVFAASPRPNMIGEVRGNVRILPKGAKPRRGFLGDIIDVFELMMVGKGASGTLVCSNGLTRSLSAGTFDIDKICGKQKTSTTHDPRGYNDLSYPENEELQEELKILSEQPLNNEAKSIATAHLYRSKGLNMEAIEVLEKLVAGGSKTTAVYQLLGDIYYDVRIKDMAKNRYETGLKLAQKEGNLVAVKMIQAGLLKIDTSAKIDPSN
jgi:hypothetical protein